MLCASIYALMIIRSVARLAGRRGQLVIGQLVVFGGIQWTHRGEFSVSRALSLRINQKCAGRGYSPRSFIGHIYGAQFNDTAYSRSRNSQYFHQKHNGPERVTPTRRDFGPRTHSFDSIARSWRLPVVAIYSHVTLLCRRVESVGKRARANLHYKCLSRALLSLSRYLFPIRTDVIVSFSPLQY